MVTGHNTMLEEGSLEFAPIYDSCVLQFAVVSRLARSVLPC